MNQTSGWLPACDLEALPHQSTRGISLEGEAFILVNWHGRVLAYLNHCPHAGWPLNLEPDKFFDAEQRYLQCSNHLALFDVDTGTCIAGPCPGSQLTPVPTRISQGKVFLRTAAT